MFHLKSIGNDLEDYFWKKSRILEMFGIKTDVMENHQWNALQFQFQYKPTKSNVVFSLSHHDVIAMKGEAIKYWIDRAFEDAMVYIFREIEQKVDNKQYQLVKPPSFASWVGGDLEIATDSTYGQKQLAVESFKEAVKSLKEQPKKHEHYAPYDYFIGKGGTAGKMDKNPPESVSSTGMGLISKTFDMKQHVMCAKCEAEFVLETAVIHMNDTEGMTREEIADYLETQDLDLKMKIAAD